MSNAILPHSSPSPWHARQAAMLYEYASLNYLKKLHKVVTQLIDGVVDPLLTISASQGRDALLKNGQWETRNTSENWANNAWPFLKELQGSLAKDIAMRAFDQYKITATSECLRGAEQFSMQWATADEEKEYERAVALVNSFASNIDYTLFPQREPRWSDYDFFYAYAGFKAESPRIPKFRIRTDLIGETGGVPPRTGVYIAADDPNAALQFAVSGNAGIRLREASTFNQIGLDALAAVGRNDLWFNQQKMVDFATKSKHAALLDRRIALDCGPNADLAAPYVAMHAFETHPAKWYFVEIVPDEFDDVELTPSVETSAESPERRAGGET
jgi:hypothetical protein